MSRTQRLRKAIRDRAKRTRDLINDLAKEERAGKWRVARTAYWLRRYEREKDPKRKAAFLRKYYESRDKVRQQRKKVSAGRKAVQRSRAKLAQWRRRSQPQDAGAKAVAFLVRRAGWHESPPGSNDAKFLSNWRRALNMGWMRGQPWCGFACIAAYHYAAKKNLPADTVSTIAIANRARIGNGYKAIPFGAIKTGDLVVFNFGSGGPKHVGLARGPARNGVVPTVEGNTSASNGGSQSNGGMIALRTRSRGLVHTIARPK